VSSKVDILNADLIKELPLDQARKASAFSYIAKQRPDQNLTLAKESPRYLR